MKHCLTVGLITAVSFCSFAAEYNAPIRAVTVYDSSALITRGTTVNLPAGTSVITIPGLLNTINSKTLTAKIISPDAAVSSVALRYKVQPPPANAEVTKCRLALETAEQAYGHNQDQQKQVRDEIQRLQKLSPAAPPRKADGKPQQYDPAAADALLTYIQTSLTAQYNALRELEKQGETLNRNRITAREAYNKLKSQNHITKVTAEITVHARQAVRAPLEITYQIHHVSWYPAYEIRVNPENHLVQISSFAILQQSTGENWQNIPVCFSTAIPSLSADLPQLTTKKITEQFVTPQPVAARSRFMMRKEKHYAPQAAAYSQDTNTAGAQNSYIKQQGIWKNTIQFNNGKELTINEPLEQVSDDTIQYRTASGQTATINLNEVKQISAVSTATQGLDYPIHKLKNPAKATAGLDFKFHSAAPVNAPSNGEYQKIPLTTQTLQGTMYYHFIPHYSRHAYRKCEIVPEKTMAILAGPAGIFYGSEFIGNTDLQTILPSEGKKFTVNVGVDQRIKLKRTISKKAEDTGVFTDLRKTSFRIETTFSNPTGKSMKYELIEQIPATSTDKIRITDIKLDNTTLKHTGKYGQDDMKTLAPGAAAKHVLTYTIQYPANYIITHRIHGGRPIPGFGLEEKQK